MGERLLKVANDPQLKTSDLHASMRSLRAAGEGVPRNKLIDDAYLKYVMPERMQLKMDA